MRHKTTCRWVLTTNVECEYRQTHHYCPHPEHACDCQTPTPTGADAVTRATRYAGQLSGMTNDQIAVSELCEAIRITVEYVGTDVLPPIPGWAWFDTLARHDPAMAAKLVTHYRLHGKCADCKHRVHTGEECGAPVFGQPALDGSIGDTDVVDICECGLSREQA